MQVNIVILNLKEISDKQKVVIENLEANFTKWGKQLSVPLVTKMMTMKC
jgi:hypothetical protein